MSGYAFTIPLPAGAVGGDQYLLWVSSQSNDTVVPTPTVNGFTLIGVGAEMPFRWDFLYSRDHDGLEPASVFVEDLIPGFVRAECVLIHGADHLAFQAGDWFSGDNTVLGAVDIDAVTTTVDETLVLLGFQTYDPSSDGPDVTAGTVDTTVALFDSNTCTVWAREVALSGTEGPWTVNRADETPGGTDFGGSWWTVTAVPVSGDPVPTIIDETHDAGFGDVPAGTPPDQPPLYVLVNPDNPDQSVTIQGATQDEQDALIAAQLAAWAAEADMPIPAFLAAVDGWITAWDAADYSGETVFVQTVIDQLRIVYPALQTIAAAL